VEEQVLGGLGQRAQAGSGVREREQPAKEDVRRAGLREHGHQGCALPKVVTPAAKQAAVGVMTTPRHRLSKARACRIVGLSRTVLYRPKVNRLERDQEVIDAINEVLRKRPGWGFWKCFDRIRLDGHVFNHKRVHRVYCEMKLNMKRRTKKRVITRSDQPLVYIQAVNHTWTLDFMRDTLYDGRPFQTLNVIDEGNREALRIEVGTSISAARVVRVMNELIEVYGKPAAIRLDNGPELTAELFTDWAKKHGTQLRFIQPGKPNQNALIERFNKSLRDEVLDANPFNTLSEVQQAVDEWITDYNEYRPHESLGRIPSTVFLPRAFKPETSTSRL
jgi:putative transposase